MKGVFTALLVGTAIAGIIYYLKENGMIQGESKKLRRGSSYIHDQMKEGWNDAGKEVTNALADQP